MGITSATLPSPRTVLAALPKLWLAEYGRDLGLDLTPSQTRDAQIDALLPVLPPLSEVVGRLGRDELRAVCRALDLDDRARSRTELAARILGTTPDALAAPGTSRAPRDLPRAGDIVHARHRQYLVSVVALATSRATVLRAGGEARLAIEDRRGARAAFERALALSRESDLEPDELFAIHVGPVEACGDDEVARGSLGQAIRLAPKALHDVNAWWSVPRVLDAVARMPGDVDVADLTIRRGLERLVEAGPPTRRRTRRRPRRRTPLRALALSRS